MIPWLFLPSEKRHRVSALGLRWDTRGGLLFLVNVLMTLKPELFGLADAAAGVRWSFTVAGRCFPYRFF